MSHHRAGQVVSFIVIALAAAGFLTAIFFPWTIDTTTASIGSCTQTTTRMWKQQVVTCTNCGALAPAFCNSNTDWTQNCTSTSDPSQQGSAYCKFQYLVWYSSWGLNIGIVCIMCLALVLYVVNAFGKIEAHWAIAGMSFALLVAVIVLIVFSVGLPIAINKDANDKNNQPEDQPCSQGPCKDFIGSMAPTGSTRKWTVDNGWIIFCASTVFLLFGTMIVGLFGRGGDEKHKSVGSKIKGFFRR